MGQLKFGGGSLSIQDILSFGYLYLLMLGIASDSIYYGMLGINIISYSNVLDVILSPIVHLTSNIQFPIIIIVFPILLFFFLKFIEGRQKKASQTEEAKNEKSLPFRQLWMLVSAMVIFSAFFGYGLGGGAAIKAKMQKGTIKADHLLELSDRSKIKVQLIGNTSAYLFYIKEGNQVVTIAPVSDNILAIEKL